MKMTKTFIVCLGLAGLVAGAWRMSQPTLHSAAARGNLSSIRSYQNSANLQARLSELRTTRWYGGKDVFYLTPLMWAARERQLQAIDLLIQLGSDINQQDKFGRTALWFAVVYADLPCVELLLRHGADPNAEANSGGRALDIAIRRNDRDVVQRLCGAGADVNDGALIEAVDRGRVDLVQDLLLAGADPALATVGNMSLLEFIRSKKSPAMREIEEILLTYHKPDAASTN